MTRLPASKRFAKEAGQGPWQHLEGPGGLLAGDRFLLAFGVGTGPAVHLACQESSRCSVNVSTVLLNLHAAVQSTDGPDTQAESVQAH